MAADERLSIRFWGTRGTMTPMQASPVFGIHTTAVEVFACGAPPFFIDLGTGAVKAAESALADGTRQFDIFLTHLHFDHIAGAVCFEPLYRSDSTVTIHGVSNRIKETIEGLFASPYYPVGFDALKAMVNFDVLASEGAKELKDHKVMIRWNQLAHPQGCTAYRIEAGANAIVFATDVELGGSNNNDALRSLMIDPFPAGLAVIDGAYTEAEVAAHRNWGHSSWKEAWSFGRECNVGQILITHHNPRRTDEELVDMEASSVAGLRWAREETVWSVRGNHAEQN